jgi:uncharacterized protein (UPF0332 family)
MMTAVMVDSNVMLDLMTEDARWLSWSAAAVENAADRFRLVINPTGAFLDKSRGLLGQADTMLAVGLTDAAGRTAYLAGLHAAQALIFERTSKVIKRHRGVQNELQRLTKDEPRFDPELRAFLVRTYNLKAIADYDTDPDTAVTAEEAQEAVETAKGFVARIAELLA